MTTRELIEKLQQMPPNADVILVEDKVGYNPEIIDARKEDMKGRMKVILYAD